MAVWCGGTVVTCIPPADCVCRVDGSRHTRPRRAPQTVHWDRRHEHLHRCHPAENTASFPAGAPARVAACPSSPRARRAPVSTTGRRSPVHHDHGLGGSNHGRIGITRVDDTGSFTGPCCGRGSVHDLAEEDHSSRDALGSVSANRAAGPAASGQTLGSNRCGCAGGDSPR